MRTPIHSAKITAAGIAAGTFDASQTAGVTLFLDVLSLAAGKCARIAVEDSAAGDFSDALPVALWLLQGPITTDTQQSLTPREIPGARLATPTSKLRVNVLTLDAAANLSANVFADPTGLPPGPPIL